MNPIILQNRDKILCFANTLRRPVFIFATLYKGKSQNIIKIAISMMLNFQL